MKEKKSVALFYTIIIFMCMGIGELAVLNATEYYEVTTNDGGTDVGYYDVVLTMKDSKNYKGKQFITCSVL